MCKPGLKLTPNGNSPQCIFHTKIVRLNFCFKFFQSNYLLFSNNSVCCYSRHYPSFDNTTRYKIQNGIQKRNQCDSTERCSHRRYIAWFDKVSMSFKYPLFWCHKSNKQKKLFVVMYTWICDDFPQLPCRWSTSSRETFVNWRKSSYITRAFMKH